MGYSSVLRAAHQLCKCPVIGVAGGMRKESDSPPSVRLTFCTLERVCWGGLPWALHGSEKSQAVEQSLPLTLGRRSLPFLFVAQSSPVETLSSASLLPDAALGDSRWCLSSYFPKQCCPEVFKIHDAFN